MLTIQRGRTMRDGALVRIAAKLYKRRSGAWPTSVEVLVPGLLPMVPRDPWEGAALRLRVIAGALTLYSVGGDKEDDGGAVAAGRGDAETSTAADFSKAGSPVSVPSDWVLWRVPQGDGR